MPWESEDMKSIAENTVTPQPVQALWAGAKRTEIRSLYSWLMANSRALGEFDSHIFACVLAARAAEPEGSLCESLGLELDALSLLIDHYFPGTVVTGDPSLGFKCQMRLACGVEDNDALHGGKEKLASAKETFEAAEALISSSPHQPGLGVTLQQDAWLVDVVEEEIDDLRNLLLDHRSLGLIEEEWLASIIAKACQGSGHLWEDLGFTCRQDLSLMLQRHFFRLYNKNTENMKWKKFLYKYLCDQEGIDLCKAPNCRDCSDFDLCFGPE